MSKLRYSIAFLIILMGIILMFYPWISNWLYEHRIDSEAVAYHDQVNQRFHDTDSGQIDDLFAEAIDYNARLAHSNVIFTDPFVFDDTVSDKAYANLLCMNDSGILCFVEIPKISVRLPVYHSTDPEALEKGAEHLEGSSLPVGGAGTHAVISAHSGINRSKMFSDLNLLKEDDLFYIHVLNRTLSYRVCEIQVIRPQDTGILAIQKDRDLVSLITCTPYGVNSHRLVVTGERTENTPALEEEIPAETQRNESEWMKSYRKAVSTGVIIVLLTALGIKLASMLRKKNGEY